MGKQLLILSAGALVLGVTLFGCTQECSVAVETRAKAVLPDADVMTKVAEMINSQPKNQAAEQCTGGNDLPAHEQCYFADWQNLGMFALNITLKPASQTLDASVGLMGAYVFRCAEAKYSIDASGVMTVDWAAACDANVSESRIESLKYCGSTEDSFTALVHSDDGSGIVIPPGTEFFAIASACPPVAPKTSISKCTFKASSKCCDAAKENMPYINDIQLNSSDCDEYDRYYAAHGAVCEDRTDTCKNVVDMAQFKETCRGDLDGIKVGTCVGDLGDPDPACMIDYFGEKYTDSCSLSLADLMTCAVAEGKKNCISKCISNQNSDECRTCGEKAMIDFCLDQFEMEGGIGHCPFVFAPEPQTLYDLSIQAIRLKSSVFLPGVLGTMLLAACTVGVAWRRRAAFTASHVELLSQQGTE